jgi:hypothetical protein
MPFLPAIRTGTPVRLISISSDSFDMPEASITSSLLRQAACLRMIMTQWVEGSNDENQKLE